MKKILICFVMTLAVITQAQDPLFFNTNQSLIYLNPSFAGTNGGVRIQMSYRDQWPNLSANYITYLGSFDAYIKPLRGGISVSIFSDGQARGTLKTTYASIGYAQHFSLYGGTLKIIPSLQAAYGMKTLDRDNLRYGDMIDARYGAVWTNPLKLPVANKNYVDVSSGLLVNWKDLYVGASVLHFNQPDIGLVETLKMPALYNLHASYNRAVSGNMLLHVSMRVLRQQQYTVAQGAVTMVYKRFIAGAGYRSGTAAFINAGFRNSNVTFMLGWDTSLSRLDPPAIGGSSWEMMLSFNAHKERPKGVTTNLENW